MAYLKQVLRIAAAAAGGLLYVWFAGVRNAARAKRRRAAKRAGRRDARSPPTAEAGSDPLEGT